jgi:hypothetical protein
MRIMRVFRKVGPYGAVAVSLLFGAPALGQELGQEWTALTVDKAKIVFQGPALENKIERRMRTNDANYQYSLEIALWTGPLARLPTAQVLHLKLMPGYHFRAEPDPKSLISEFEVFEGKELDFARLRSKGNRLGRVKSRRFQIADIDCVGFLQQFGESGGDLLGAGTERVFGYYCADPGVPLPDETVDAVLGGIGVKGLAVP